MVVISNSLKRRIAENFAGRLAAILRKVLLGATSWLPRTGREHVRTSAFTRFVDAMNVQGLREVDLQGIGVLLCYASSGPCLVGLEPETLTWIDRMVANGDVVYDLGANVGLYSLYCVKRHPESRVVAFEPNPFTFSVLIQHVLANSAADRMLALPFALAATAAAIERFELASTLPGTALHQLRVEGARSEHQVPRVAGFPVPVFAVDHVVEMFSLPPADHLKLDVDGIEPLVLAGATKTLNRVRSVLIEVVEESLANHEAGETSVVSPLHKAGLVEDPEFRKIGTGNNRLFIRKDA